MKIFNTEISLGLTILLVLLTILFFFIVVPFMIVVGICCLFNYIFTGRTPAETYRQNKADRHDRIYEGPADHAPQDNVSATDETIECEVISARTLDENDREAR